MNPVARLNAIVSRLWVPKPVSTAIAASGCVGLGDQLAGPGDPPRLDERTRREAGGHPESAREVEHAQAGSGRQIGERQRTVEPGLDVDLDAAEGRRGQAAAQMR